MEEREAFWKAIEKLVRDSNIVIDRPKGTAHPRFPDFIYKIDYGYLENTSSMDQGGIDGVFICNARNTYSVCRILEERNTDKDVLVVGTDLYRELGRFFENGILDAVICQYQWEQGEVAVQKMQDYLSRGIRDQEDEVISPVLLLKSNYACFLEEE